MLADGRKNARTLDLKTSRYVQEKGSETSKKYGLEKCNWNLKKCKKKHAKNALFLILIVFLFSNLVLDLTSLHARMKSGYIINSMITELQDYPKDH